MSQPLLTEIVGDIRYQVFYDEYLDFDIDFDTEQEKEEYIAKFERGDLISAYIIKEQKCECCDGYKFIDQLNGIHTECPKQALTYYKSEHEVSA